jgi:hypothetical protein
MLIMFVRYRETPFKIAQYAQETRLEQDEHPADAGFERVLKTGTRWNLT